MAVGGLGGLITQLINPNLDRDLARQLTPNPSPLAQQGAAGPGTVDALGNPSPGAPAPASGPPMPPAAAPAPDPINASYNANLIKAARQDAYAADLNRNLEGIAAGFGTAQQQASKQAALGRGGVGDTLGDLARIQAMQKETIADNEHARFMGNAAIFAQTLSTSLGRPVSVAEATEIMNNPELMQQFGSAAAANATFTGTTKDADEATRSYIAAHPNATPQEIADFRASVISMATGGGNIEDQQYRAYALAERAAGRDPVDKLTWIAQHAQAAKETEDAHKIALQLPGLKSQLTSMDQRADTLAADPNVIQGIMSSTSKQSAASQIFNWDGKGQDPAILYGNGKALTTEETTFVQNARQLHLANYASNFKDATPGQRLSQQEAMRLGNAADQLGNFTGTVDDYMGRINDVKNRIGHALGNAHGEAHDLDSLPIQYRSKIDPSFLEGPNALKNLPKWAVPVAVNSQADLDAVPYGQAYKPGPNFGKYSGKILFKGQEAGYEDY